MNKPVYTVRCTVIESFREWINCEDAEDKFWITEENVIGNIKGIERYNVKAAYGSAGHALIERADKYKISTEQEFFTVASGSDVMPIYDPGYAYVVDGFTFTEEQAKPIIKHRNEHPLWVREVALSKLYSTPNFDLIITGTTDAVEGITLRDTKFKFSQFDVADFIDSFQWRCYLDMIGLDIFYYDFFKVSGFNTIEDCPKAQIHECESMMVKRYTGMEQDIATVINEFADWITFKNLHEYLVITQAKKKRIINGDYRLAKLITI